MSRRSLPIGIQTLREIREGDFYYVDKTGAVVLVDEYDKPILDNITDPEMGRALQQIKARGYANKYRAEGLPIHLIGIEFSRGRRALVGFDHVQH